MKGKKGGWIRKKLLKLITGENYTFGYVDVKDERV